MNAILLFLCLVNHKPVSVPLHLADSRLRELLSLGLKWTHTTHNHHLRGGILLHRG